MEFLKFIFDMGMFFIVGFCIGLKKDSIPDNFKLFCVTWFIMILCFILRGFFYDGFFSIRIHLT